MIYGAMRTYFRVDPLSLCCIQLFVLKVVHENFTGNFRPCLLFLDLPYAGQ